MLHQSLFPYHLGSYLERDAGLVRAIVEGRAVAFVGAGVSAASGMPLWNSFLQKVLTKYSQRIKERGNDLHRALERCLKDGRLIQAADLLEHWIPSEFAEEIRSTFYAPGLKPSDLHRQIASIPFSLAVTTNVDPLLEAAYRGNSPVPVLSWKEPHVLLRALKFGEFAILKKHGDAFKTDTAIFSTTGYQVLTHGNESFREAMRTILLTKTALFIGYSFNDPDLISLLDELYIRHGNAFGPHYAILPVEEASVAEVDHYHRRYNITVFSYAHSKKEHISSNGNVQPRNSTHEKPKQEQHGQWGCQHEPGVEDFRTEETRLILRRFAGDAARRIAVSTSTGISDLERELAYRNKALKELLDSLLLTTRALRGDICLRMPFLRPYRDLDIEGLQANAQDSKPKRSLVSRQLYYDIQSEPLDPSFKTRRDETGRVPVADYSVCGRCYYLTRRDDVLALDDISNAHSAGYGHLDYELGHSDVRSEIATPIYADGIRVGVLNLEFASKKAFDDGHKDVLKLYAHRAGEVVSFFHAKSSSGRQLRLIANHESKLMLKRSTAGQVVNALNPDSNLIADGTKDVDRQKDTLAAWLQGIIENVDLYEGCNSSKEARTDSPLVLNSDFTLLIYTADYVAGELRSQVIEEADTDKWIKVIEGRNPIDENDSIFRNSFLSEARKHAHAREGRRDPLTVCFRFSDPTLATMVFSSRTPIRDIHDAWLEYVEGKRPELRKRISGRYFYKLGISGSVWGIPLFVNGTIAGVVAIWKKYGMPGNLDSRHFELIRRCLHCVINDSSIRELVGKGRAELATIGGKLEATKKAIDDLLGAVLNTNSHNWAKSGEELPEFSSIFQEVLPKFSSIFQKVFSLEDRKSSFAMRLWIRDKTHTDQFGLELIAKKEVGEANPSVKNIESSWSGLDLTGCKLLTEAAGGSHSNPEYSFDKNKRTITFSNDKYLRKLIHRARMDPFARLVVGSDRDPDPKAELFGKKTYADWITAPIWAFLDSDSSDGSTENDKLEKPPEIEENLWRVEDLEITSSNDDVESLRRKQKQKRLTRMLVGYWVLELPAPMIENLSTDEETTRVDDLCHYMDILAEGSAWNKQLRALATAIDAQQREHPAKPQMAS